MGGGVSENLLWLIEFLKSRALLVSINELLFVLFILVPSSNVGRV